MAVTLVTTIKRFEGTAAEMAAMDVTGVPAGSTFFQNDTGLIFSLSAAGAWTEKKTNGTMQLSASTALAGKFIPVDTDGDEKFTSGNPASVQLSGSKTGKEASDTITRGNDATPYAVGDVVSTLAGEVMEFASVGEAGQLVAILGTRMRIDLDAAVTAGITGWRLHLYNAAPTAIADNAAFNIPAADRAKYLGYVYISTPIRFDDTQWSQDDSINATFKLAGTSLFGILETLGAYTPTANAVKTIYLEVAGV